MSHPRTSSRNETIVAPIRENWSILLIRREERGAVTLVVEDDIEEGAMTVQAAVVLDEAHLPKLVHEETHPGPRRPDHFGEGFLTDSGHHGLMLPVFAEAGQQQQNPRQPL